MTIDVNDHCPTFVPFVTHSITGGEESVKVFFRCDTEENRENFMAKLKPCEWRMGNINVNAVANLFISQLNKLYCDCFPVKTKYTSPKRLQKPWLTTDIVEMIAAKSKYFKWMKLGVISVQTNRSFRNKVTSAILLLKCSLLATQWAQQ